MVKPSLDTADLESHAIPFPTVVPLGTTLDPREEGVFPEGGTAAWLSLLGCFCAWMAAFGLMNTTGTFQAYLEVHQLAVYSASDIGWIFGLYFFVAFVTGVQIGPIFDALGPRLLTAVGSVCLIACMFLLEACKRK